MMVAAVVIWIGESKSALFSAVEKKYTTTLVRSGRRGIEEARSNPSKIVIIDADSLKMSGTRIVQSLQTALPHLPILLLSSTPTDGARDLTIAPTIEPRQLLTHMKRLMAAPKSNVISCGEFTLDMTRRVLRVRGEEIAVNPKQCKLLEAFFTRPNITIERATLMKEVWNTDYMGDTRTLDVHVRWLREKGIPLVTVRGVGYRLVVSP